MPDVSNYTPSRNQDRLALLNIIAPKMNGCIGQFELYNMRVSYLKAGKTCFTVDDGEIQRQFTSLPEFTHYVLQRYW